jgi:hypothetical protein
MRALACARESPFADDARLSMTTPRAAPPLDVSVEVLEHVVFPLLYDTTSDFHAIHPEDVTVSQSSGAQSRREAAGGTVEA